MTTSRRPPLPQRTPGTTSIPVALAPIKPETDRDLLGRVLAGLEAIVDQHPVDENSCTDAELDAELRGCGDDVRRLLGPACSRPTLTTLEPTSGLPSANRGGEPDDRPAHESQE
ncbi:MAG: hypothetical protein J2P17_09295 [Mycobacterium sp.]|nr:hypothetical protein [Mycobacterium sp.]